MAVAGVTAMGLVSPASVIVIVIIRGVAVAEPPESLPQVRTAHSGARHLAAWEAATLFTKSWCAEFLKCYSGLIR